ARGPKDERWSSRRSSRDARAASFAPLLADEGWSRYGARRAQPVAISRKSLSRRNGRNKPKPFAVGCDRLPRGVHGKQGVCRGLPPVAGGPLPAKEGVDLSCFGARYLLLLQSGDGLLQSGHGH